MSRMANTIPGLSYFRQGVILSQHRVEEILLADLAEHPNIEIQRRVTPSDLHFNATEAESNSAYPITMHVERVHGGNPEGLPERASVKRTASQRGTQRRHSMNDARKIVNRKSVQTIKAKYLIGCDGAHSWTRNHLDIHMHGEQTDYVWGVLDVIPITDFPDIRSRCAIRSASSGSIMLIPREGRLVRIYCQLQNNEKSEENDGRRLDRSQITADSILRTAQEIFKPYTFTYTHLEDFTVYQVCPPFTQSSSLKPFSGVRPVLKQNDRSTNASDPASASTIASSSPATQCTHIPRKRVRA